MEKVNSVQMATSPEGKDFIKEIVEKYDVLEEDVYTMLCIEIEESADYWKLGDDALEDNITRIRGYMKDGKSKDLSNPNNIATYRHGVLFFMAVGKRKRTTTETQAEV